MGTAHVGEILVSLRECTPQAVEAALRRQRSFGARLGTNLLLLGAATETAVARALGVMHGVRSMAGEIRVDPATAALVNRSVAERYGVVPYLTVGREVGVLVRDPSDLTALDDVAFALGRDVHPVVVPEIRLWSLLKKYYGINAAWPGAVLPEPGVADTRLRPAA